ncbi:MAG TPA: dihydroorotate dehydrogenase-like protein [Bacteroidales bacterium]|nr:dihydroorotate dehydrogenase-like protein [Bacteroidales bacterium]
MNLSTTYSGLHLKNPIIAASSGLTDSVEKIIDLEKQGAAAVVLKSLFEEEIIAEMDSKMKQMASTGFIYPETLDYYDKPENDEEESALKYLKLIKDAKAAVNIPIIASINCVSSKNWTYFPRQIEEAGADALELNLFVLPTDFSRESADNENVYFEIICEVLKHVKIPVSIKISFYFSNLGSMVQRLARTGIKGIVLFNRFYSPDIDIDKMQVTSGFVLSNPAELALSLRWTAIMSDRINCDIAASTGVHSGEDMIKQLLAGAKAVQIASTLYKNYAGQIETMLNELKEWMQSKEFNSIEEFRGKLAQKNIKNPAAYERIQFMKNFRGYRG